MIHYQDDWLTILIGDCRERLAELPAESVHCVVTSPPYWGLRDYGTATWLGGDAGCDHLGPPHASGASTLKNDGRPADRVGQNEYERAARLPFKGTCGKCGAVRQDRQLGLEPTPEEFVANMVGVFREVRRVLRNDGTLWLNLGSSYASGDSGPSRSRQPERAPAYGSDGTGPSGSSAPGSACSDLCDECLADYLSHLSRSAGTLPLPGQVELLPELTGRDIEPPGSEQASLVAGLPYVPASTTLQSWRQLRGSCSRCDSRATALSGARSSSGDGLDYVRNSWLNYTSKLKPKDMVPVPWMVAMALQEDGWYLRSDVIWAKPNPMPESVTDRPTKSHEYLFLLTKSARYFYDADAVREAAEYGRREWSNGRAEYDYLGTERTTHAVTGGDPSAGRNLRTVWTIATEPYPGAHFATFPQKLVEPCIKAGSPVGGTVLDPFAGSGTTLMVAQRLSRRAIGIDLSADYLDQAMIRNAQRPLGIA